MGGKNVEFKNLSKEDLKLLVISLKKSLNDKNAIITELYNKINDFSEKLYEIFAKDDVIYNSKKELELIFDASDDCIVILDDNYRIKRVNKMFCELVNKGTVDIIGTKFTDYFDDDAEFKKDIEDPNLPTNTFIETVYYSKKYNKTFLIKSRKLKNDHYPLVYIHITSDVSKRGENVR